MLVRANAEGLYASRDAGVGNDWAHSDQLLITRRSTERIIRHAFELATRRSGAPADSLKRVTCVGQILTAAMMLEYVGEAAAKMTRRAAESAMLSKSTEAMKQARDIPAFLSQD